MARECTALPLKTKKKNHCNLSSFQLITSPLERLDTSFDQLSQLKAMSNLISKIETEQLKEDSTSFNVGDTVKVHCLVREGDKERVQIFAGLVIAKRGGGLNESFTVRKISYGEGVERVFPTHSPRVAKVEVTAKGKVRRAKLHYLRDRVGKRALQVKAVDRA